MKLYILQYKQLNGKWKWDKNWVDFDKKDLEEKFLRYYNDCRGYSTMETLKHVYRIRSIDVTLPKVIK